MTKPAKPDDRKRLLFGIMLAIAVWGSFLALGAFLFGPDEQTGGVKFSPSVARGGIVAGCVAIFLAWWGFLLRMRRRST